MPLSLPEIDDLGLGAQVFQKMKGTGASGQNRDSAVRVFQVSKIHGVAGTGFDAGRCILVRSHLSLLGCSAVPGLEEAMGAEGTLLDHPQPPHIDIRVEALLHAFRDAVVMPIEILDTIGTGGHTEPTPDASLPDLCNNPFWITVG
jgi:hypothetical protein